MPKKSAKSKKSKPKKSPKKKAAKKKGVRKKAPAKAKKKKLAAAPKIKGTLVGHVTHYFDHVQAAAVKVEAGQIKIGDRLYFKGHTTDFEETLESLQIDHVSVPKAGRGAEAGIRVKSRVREGDAVYKV
ncbi:MAG: hypothetical protein HYZ85_04030 [Candidatus Omnitrophica bacterium]|nr:hypothetical protein [Candidatus Omnitrophota bacterium]